MAENDLREIGESDITAYVDPFEQDSGIHSHSGPYSSEEINILNNQIITLQHLILSSGNQELKNSIDFERHKINDISFNMSEFLDEVSKLVIDLLGNSILQNKLKKWEQLLELFKGNKGKLITKKYIYEKLGMDLIKNPNGLNPHLRKTRNSLGEGVLIDTVHGQGFVYGNAEERQKIIDEYKAKPKEKSNRITKTDKILDHFVQNRGKLVTRKLIIEAVEIEKENAVTPHLVKLRKKDLGKGIQLDTVRGQGFVYGTQEERDKIHDEYKTVKVSSNKKNENFLKFSTLFEENIGEVFSRDDIFNRTQLPKTSFPPYIKKMKQKFSKKEKMFDNLRGKGYILGTQDEINEKRRELGVLKSKDRLFNYFMKKRGSKAGIFLTRKDITVDLKISDTRVSAMLRDLEASIYEYNNEQGYRFDDDKKAFIGNKALGYSVVNTGQRGYFFGTNKAINDRTASILAGTYKEEIVEEPKQKIENKKIKKGALGRLGDYDVIINQDNISFGGVDISFDTKKHDFLHLVILNAINGAPTSKQFLEKKKGMNPSGYEIAINKTFEDAGIKLRVLTVGSFGDYSIR